MIDRTSQSELPLRIKQIVRSVRRGVYMAALEHQRDGMPMVIWRNGQIEWVSADEVLAELRQADSTLSDEAAL